MSEIFDEVDDDLRREKLNKLWQRYGNLILAGAVLIVLAVGGWRGYQYWETQKATAASSAFEAAATLAEQDKHAEAQAAFGTLVADGPQGYRTLAKLRIAADLAPRDQAAAVKLYDEIVADGSVPAENRQLAALRAAALLLDKSSYADMQKRLVSLTVPDGVYRHSAREYLALSAWRNNDAVAARQWIDMITTDEQTPTTLRQRVESLQALLPPAAKS